jgi:hypothetical protein
LFTTGQNICRRRFSGEISTYHYGLAPERYSELTIFHIDRTNGCRFYVLSKEVIPLAFLLLFNKLISRDLN